MTTVISVENLSKVYRLGQIGTGTISYDLQLWWAKMRGKPNPLLRIGEIDHGNLDGQDLWALRDVSFTVKQGEVLGIIGKNGAGKSTLLKILSRVTAPTSGRVRVKGHIASLLEVGTGFHPELTGRENTYLNGAILGMSRDEIDRKFDEIVDFSGVEKFIDTPVKRYSSGMYVRLAFAVAAHLEPEILLVDEVLAVGDAEFQKKCLGKMGDVAQEGRTVLFVSHNMGAIIQLCQKAILISDGQIARNGIASEIVQAYLDNTNSENTSTELSDWPTRLGSGAARFTRVATKNSVGDETNQYFIGDSLYIEVEIRTFKKIDTIRIAIGVRDSAGLPIILAADVDGDFRFDSPKELEIVEMVITDLRLYPGTYYLMLWMADIGYETFDKVEDCLKFEVVQGGEKVMRTLPRSQAVVYTTPSWCRR